MRFHKHIIGLLCLIFILAQGLFAQEKMSTIEYHSQMKSSLHTLYKAGNIENFKRSAQQLRKIAEQEQTKWVPFYHTSYAYVMAAFMSKEKFEAEEMLNQAQMMVDKANKFSPSNSEIIALQGFIYQARVGINPKSKIHEFVQKAVQCYDQARFIKPENPRPYYLLGQILYRLPETMGGNKENACKHFQQASEKYQTFKPRSEFSPNWGAEGNLLMLEKCKQ